ncbi:hypothetical protein J3E69DRAFT_90387 [Trichoderma sp. SZMC 28015]
MRSPGVLKLTCTREHLSYQQRPCMITCLEKLTRESACRKLQRKAVQLLRLRDSQRSLPSKSSQKSVQRGPSCHVGTTSTPPHPRLLSTPKRPPPPLSAYLEPQGFGGLWLGSGIDEWRSCTTPSVQGPPIGDVSRYLDGRWWVNLVRRGVGLVRVRHGSSSSPAAVWSMIAECYLVKARFIPPRGHSFSQSASTIRRKHNQGRAGCKALHPSGILLYFPSDATRGRGIKKKTKKSSLHTCTITVRPATP